MGFLGEFVGYLQTRTDAPKEFHLHAGLCALAAAIGNRVASNGRARPIYPNLWSVIIAPSGHGKSVPLDMAVKMLRLAGLGNYLLPNSWSQEGLFATIADQSVGIFVHQEFGRFMEILGKEYNADAMYTLTEYFDVPEEDTRVLRGKKVTVHHPTLTMLGASSPDWFSNTYKASMLRGGFLSRFLFCPDSRRGEPVDFPPPPDERVETALADHLRRASMIAGTANFDDVRDEIVPWVRQTRESLGDGSPDFAGMRSRAELFAVKAAMLFHVSQNTNDLRITPEEAHHAMRFVERARQLAESYIATQVAQDKEDDDCLRVLREVQRLGGRASRSVVMNNTHISAGRMDRAERTLRESERLDVVFENKLKMYAARGGALISFPA